MICRHCGEQFDSWETEQFYESVPYGGHYFDIPVLTACPVCGSSELAREDVCAECGEILEAEEMTGGLCRCCAQEAAAYVRELWAGLSGVQRRWIRGHMDQILED